MPPKKIKQFFFGMLRPENRHFAGGTGGRRSRPPREHGGVHLGGPGVEYRLVWSSAWCGVPLAAVLHTGPPAEEPGFLK